MTPSVLHLIPTLGYGGAERQLAILAAAQRAAGYDVHVGVLRGGPNRARLEDAGVGVHELAWRGHHDPLMIISAMRLVRRLRPAVVQSWLPLMDVIAAIVTRLTRTRWVLSERSSSAAYARLKDRALRLPLGRLADAVVANSEEGRALWASRTPASVSVVPNVVPAQEIVAAAPHDLSALGISPGTKVILFVGRLSPEKNIPVLLEALAGTVARTGAVALVCGSGPLCAEVESAAASPGGAIRYLGERTDVWSLMKAASVLVAPSTFEGNPTAVLEAAACGLPLVVSDIPAHRNILPDDAAVFVPAADAGALASAIEATLADPDGARARARRASAALGGWSIEKAVAGYEQAYRAAAGAR